MRHLTLLAALAVACAPDSIVFDHPAKGDGQGRDTAADSGGADTAGGDTGTGETGGKDTGAQDTGTDAQPVTYAGDVEGTLSYSQNGEQWQTSCSGSFELVVEVNGTTTGTADCGDREFSVSGDVAGAVKKGTLTAVWAVDLGRSGVDVDVEGTADGKKLAADFRYRDDTYEVDGTFSGKAQ